MIANISSLGTGPQLIVFTDLDGTLLDHHTYDYAPAQPTFERLRRHKIALILASSKTAAEMIPLRTVLGFSHCPMICENGSGTVPGGEDRLPPTNTYQRLRQALGEVEPSLRDLFQGFGDLGSEGIAEVTGLTIEAAERAAKRQFSEPGLWRGTNAQAQAFLAALGEFGITGRLGGRFLTLSFGATKALQMAAITTAENAQVTIALGDAPNDAQMLSAADYAIVLPNAQGHPVEVQTRDGAEVIHADQPGPVGWNASLGALLTRLGLED